MLGRQQYQHGGNTESCIYLGNRDCFSRVTLDTKPRKTPYGQLRLAIIFQMYENCNDRNYKYIEHSLSIGILKRYTVKPVLNGHPWGMAN